MIHPPAVAGPGLVDRITAQLRRSGLRPTRQRVELGRVLFAQGHRHLSAEDLHAEAQAAGVRVSLATVYNTLHQFTGVGLLRELAIDGSRTYFDTNTSDHHHFFVEGEGRVMDLAGDIGIGRLPAPPPGFEISAVDIVVRIRRQRQAGLPAQPPKRSSG
jgi:Fur family iron response transcriptional regulator